MRWCSGGGPSSVILRREGEGSGGAAGCFCLRFCGRACVRALALAWVLGPAPGFETRPVLALRELTLEMGFLALAAWGLRVAGCARGIVFGLLSWLFERSSVWGLRVSSGRKGRSEEGTF